MTDAHDFDEIASAHLDGTTTPEEAAHVAGDPALQARVEALRAVREAIRDQPAVDPVRRDAAIAAALAAFDDDADDSEAGTAAAPVTELAPRRGLSPTAVRVLGAAAVFVLLALLVPLLRNLGDESDTTFEATGSAIGGSADASSGSGSDSAPEAAGAPDVSTTVSAPFKANEPATYADLDALAEAVAAGDVTGRSFDAQDGAEATTGTSCSSPTAANTEVADAVVAGQPVIVWLRTDSDGSRHLTVRSADSCRVLDERDL